LSIFRADLYLKVEISNFNLLESSEKLYTILRTSPYLRNIQMTGVRHDKAVHGRMFIKEWYEISGSIDVPEGSKSFWAISKETSQEEPYNFFIRIDRNIEAEDYEKAQKRAYKWVDENIIHSIKKEFSIESIELDSPIKLRKSILRKSQ